MRSQANNNKIKQKSSSSQTTCLALAEDLCKCSVSPNIRAGVSTEVVLPEGEADPPGDIVLLPELFGCS